MSRTVAVTGAGGFIGSHVVTCLAARGWRVRALIRRRPFAPDPACGAIEVVRGPLEDPGILTRLVDVDAVVHLAGLIKAKRRADFFQVNAGHVTRLADLLGRQARPPRLILMSSLAAREPGLSDYAASKRCGEAALLDAAPSLGWTILRPPGVYGPGDRETLAFFKAVQRGVALRLGRQDARFSLIHVEDLASAIAALLDSDQADRRILEVDDGKEGGHSWRTMQDTAARAVGAAAWGLDVPAALLQTLGVFNLCLGSLPGYVPMLTPGKARELSHPDWVAKSAAIRSLISWRPAIAMERGFEATVTWYRRQGWL